MKEWTDLDYAQAAIDMLPGSVEEIVTHMRANRIILSQSWTDGWSCPVAQWVHRWTGEDNSFVTGTRVESGGVWHPVKWAVLPQPVRDFIDAYDNKRL